MIKTVKEFKVWRARFCYSPKGKKAMDKMKKLRQGNNEFPYGNLESSVLSACFKASKYQPEKDDLDSRRRIAGMQFPVSSMGKNGKRKPSHVSRNSLILHLSTFLRFYTADESTYDFVGKEVPSFGAGHPDIVADFVNAVFNGEKSDGDFILRINRRLKGVRLAHWKFSD